MTIIDINRKNKLKEVKAKENKDIHKLNLKINYLANLTDLINEADNDEFDEQLFKGVTHKVHSEKGYQYIITVTKIKP